MHAETLTADHRRKLFFLGNLSIFMIGLGFAVRANIAPDIQRDLFDVLDLSTSAAMVGEVLGATFIGFALTLLFGSALVDRVGMKHMLLFSAAGYLVGSLVVLLASLLPPSTLTYWMVFGGFLLTGLGWGAVEAASNPMVAAVYPEEKTHRLNILHAWWPGGIVVGGLLGLGFGVLDLPWQVNLLILVLPALWMIALAWGLTFPVTERVARGVSYRDMFLELFRSPGIFLWLLCMMLAAAAELAPGQWVEMALSRIVGMQGILLLVYVSVLMFVMRHFAGPIAARISPLGLLTAGGILAALGLYGLSATASAPMAFLFATLWGAGVCYMWPTLLACVGDRYPRGGALFLGLMGFAAGMSIQFVLPAMGALFDQVKVELAGGVERLALMEGPELEVILRAASVESFRMVALLPALLVPVFLGIALHERWRRR